MPFTQHFYLSHRRGSSDDLILHVSGNIRLSTSSTKGTQCRWFLPGACTPPQQVHPRMGAVVCMVKTHAERWLPVAKESQ